MSAQIWDLTVRSAAVAALEASYCDRPKFLALCTQCPNYGNNWACPPSEAAMEACLAGRGHAYLLGLRMHHDEATRARYAEDPDGAKTFIRALYADYKGRFLRMLYTMEDRFPGSYGVSAGACSLCDACTRPDGLPCRRPDRTRHSFEGFGFDVTALARDLLDTRLLWVQSGLPAYHTLINALFVPAADPAIEAAVRAACEAALV